MNVGTEMFLEVYGRQKLMVQTERHLAECSRTWRLRLERSDGRLLTGRAAASSNPIASWQPCVSN